MQGRNRHQPGCAEQLLLQSQESGTKGEEKCAPRPQNPHTKARVALWAARSAGPGGGNGQEIAPHRCQVKHTRLAQIMDIPHPWIPLHPLSPSSPQSSW